MQKNRMIQEKIKGENMGYRYIGSKARIVDEIMNYVDIYPGKGRFIDGFCGMGHVAIAAANKHWPVIVNDQMIYAGYISKARLLATSQAQFKNLGGYENVIRFLNELEGEKGFFWKEYSPASENLIGTRRQYFSINNAKKIDAIRNQIMKWTNNQLINEDERILLLVNLMEAINSVANIAGTYGCFLAKWTSQAEQPLKLEMSELRSDRCDVILSCDNVTNLDYKEDDVVYLDPPYTKRQYASYYHILETIAAEDMPVVEGVSGLRPWKEKASDFCYKRKALKSMIDLLDSINSKKILLSYSNDGHIDLDELMPEMQKLGQVSAHELKNINRYKSNNETDGRKVKEYLIVLEK